MTIWDKLTGKVARFNAMERAARETVCQEMRDFIPSRLQDYPEHTGLFTKVRDCLFAYYFGAHHYISTELDSDLSRYRSQIFSLNEHNYLHLISVLHTGFLVSKSFSDEPSPTAQTVFTLQVEGICGMYRRPDQYIVDWVNRIPWMRQSEKHRASRLANRMYDDIVPILGLPPNDVFEASNWLRISMECASSMDYCMNQPNWYEVVEAEINA